MDEQAPKVNLSKPSDPIKPLDDSFLTELARGVVTNQYVIVDIDDPAWQRSLAVLLEGLGGMPDNVGGIVVPVAPHLRGYWTRNIPAVTIQAHFIPTENIETFRTKLDTMHRALWPETPETPET